MKKLFTSLCLSLLSFALFAQITITQYDIININEFVVLNDDTMPGAAITPGSAGLNQTWDFSTLNIHIKDTIGVVDPAGTTYAAYFPNANMCGRDTSGGGFYLNKSSQFITIEGFAGMINVQGVSTEVIAPFEPADTLLKFPLQYLDWGTSNFKEIDQTEYYGGTFGTITVDSVRYKSQKNKSYVIDAWGDVTTPVGTYSCLRQNMQEVAIDSIWILPQAIPVWTFVDASKDTTQHYNWFAQNMGLQLVEMEWNADSARAEYVTWVSETNHDAIFEAEQLHAEVYPNPAKEMLFVKFDEKIDGVLRLYDIKGAVLIEKELNGMEIDILDVANYKSGVYFIECITRENKVYTTKFIKE